MGRWPKGIGVHLAGRNSPPGMAKRSGVPIYRNVGVGFASRPENTSIFLMCYRGRIGGDGITETST